MMKWVGLLKDKEFQFRFTILCVIFLLMGWQFWTVYNQNRKINVLKIENEEKRMFQLAQEKQKSVVKSEIQPLYRLEGTTIKDGAPHALINGAVYKVGDLVDKYKVTEITLRSSTLQNPLTNEIRRLDFSGE